VTTIVQGIIRSAFAAALVVYSLVAGPTSDRCDKYDSVFSPGGLSVLLYKLSAIISDSLLRPPTRVSSHILMTRDLISVLQIAGLNGNTNSISSDVY
jgi:hypothetical protein